MAADGDGATLDIVGRNGKGVAAPLGGPASSAAGVGAAVGADCVRAARAGVGCPAAARAGAGAGRTIAAAALVDGAGAGFWAGFGGGASGRAASIARGRCGTGASVSMGPCTRVSGEGVAAGGSWKSRAAWADAGAASGAMSARTARAEAKRFIVCGKREVKRAA